MPLPFAPLLLKASGLLPLAKKYWKELAVAGMIGMLLYQNFAETRFLLWIETIPSLEARLEEQKNAAQVCKDGNDKLSAAIDKRNAEVDKWRALTEEHERKIKDLNTVLKSEREETIKKTSDVLNDPTPQNCEEAIQYLRDGVEDIKW